MDIGWEVEGVKVEDAMSEELKGDNVEDPDAELFEDLGPDLFKNPDTSLFDVLDGNTSDSSVFTSDLQNPASSDTNLHITDSDSLPEDVERIESKGPVLKRKTPVVEISARPPPPISVKRQRVCEAGEESDDEGSAREAKGLSRSAVATRKLRESMKLGKLVVDERKKAAYEQKCVQMDPMARFRYQKKWEVLHSRCGKWFAMSEPYNATKFRLHVEGCMSKGQNRLIDDFFKQRDGNEKGAVTKALQPAARNHIIVGGRRSGTPIRGNLNPTPLPRVLEPKVQGCRGIGKEHNDRIPIYISRALTDGAGSRSESAITTMLFGKNVKYCQLDERSRDDVLVMQVKLRSWTICRELQVVYSTGCQSFIGSGTSTTCDECLALLKLGTFKKALRMEPPPLETAKFTPRRQYNGIRDLGISYAKIKGLAGLLDEVSTVSLSPQHLN